jgi:hypothetical protein
MTPSSHIQFETRAYPGTRGKSLRVVWSKDQGQTWHEPEDAPLEVARAWVALAARVEQRQQEGA